MRFLLSLKGLFCVSVVCLSTAVNPALAGQYTEEVTRYINGGNMNLAQGKIGAARQNYEDALKIEPKCPEAHNGIGRCFLLDGTMDKAADEFRAALRIDPLDMPSLNNLANVLYHQSKYKEAIDLYKQALKIARNSDPEILTNLGNAQKADGDYQDAIKNYQLAIKSRPNFLQSYNSLAQALCDQKKYRESLVVINKALQLNSENADAYFTLAMIHRAMFNFRGAIAAATESLKYEKNPEYLESTKQFIEKLKDLDAPFSHLRAGSSLVKQGQWRKAAEELKQATPLPDGLEVVAMNNLGIALMHQGLYSDAINLFDHAIAKNENQAQLHYNLGQALMHSGNRDAAKRSFQSAINKSNGKYVLAHNALGIAYKHENNLQAAIREYEQAIALGGAPHVVHYNLALALQQAGVYGQAIEHYKIYLSKAPHGLNAASAKQEIRIIQSQ